MKNNKKYKLNEKELINQYYEDIIKRGEYAEVRVLIEKGESESYPSVTIEKVGDKEIACMLLSLECLIKEIKKRYPFAGVLTKLIDVKSEEKYEE